jgi:triacylglycerol lipase
MDDAGPRGTRSLVAPELLPALEAMPSLEMNDEFIALLRSGALPMPPPPVLSPEQAAVRCEERFAPGAAGAPNVRVLVYTPAGEAAGLRPGYLHMHGGGYVLGAPEINDPRNRALCAEVGCVIVSVDYRLAPETSFPGAVEDCYAALKWLHAEARSLGVDASRIAIGGESAGGGHAAALAIYARDRGEIPIRLQVLDAPMIDDRTGATSVPHPFCGEFIWPPANNRFGWRALLGMEPGGPATPHGASPSRVEDLSGLPPAFIAVGALDLFLEEDLEYARRLIRAGVPTELHVVPGAFHGFSAAGEGSPQVEQLRKWQQDALARAFGAG